MEIFGILVISLTMLIGSYAAGCLPLFFTLSEGRIRSTSVFGAGILIGTTLCVIIPEGISAYYESARPRKDVTHTPLALPVIDALAASDWHNAFNRIRTTLESAVNENDALRRDLDTLTIATSALERHDAARRSVGAANTSQVDPSSAVIRRVKRHGTELPDGGDAPGAADSAVGLALIVGFLFLFVVDHYSKAQAGSRNRSVPTLGLIIHAAADGIAMGSAATATDSDMPMITFFAIMIHKAPAAFALASFLLLEGLEKSRIRRHLMAFSLAAPLSTIVTYLLLKNVESDIAGQPVGGSSTGLILLFSGGTFLYIAASHVLPELVESKCAPAMSAPVATGGGASCPHFSVAEAVIFVGAALLPALLASHHHH